MPLPENVFRVKRPSGKIDIYWQKRRGQKDAGPLVKFDMPPDAPEFWRRAKELNEGVGKTAPPPAGSISALVKHYKEESARYKALADSSKDTYGSALDVIEAAWGKLPVADLLPKHIYELQDKFADRPSMGNLTVRVLRTMLQEGVKKGYALTNVAIGIEALDEDEVGSEPWTEEAYAYVLQNAPEPIMRAAVLGRATGQRGVDLVKFRPVDRVDNGLNITVQKIGDVKHFVPIQAEALAVIDGWGVPPMVPYLTNSGRRLGEAYLREIFLTWRRKHKKTVPEDATLHDLRAMAVCDRRLKGVAHQQIADQLRMSLAMVIRYSKAIDRKANAQAGMVVFEQPGNGELKRVYAAAETRLTQHVEK